MPKNTVILLIRHAEKPASGRGLAPRGEKHALAYVHLFSNYHVGPRLVGIDALFAAADSAASARSRLTLTPLAEALKLPIQTDYEDKKIDALAARLLAEEFNGKTVLVCWKHGEILQLASALGAKPSALRPKTQWPLTWPDEEFRWILQIVYDTAGNLDHENTYCIREPALHY